MLDSVRILKKKSNGKKKARLNARGFKQIDGKHYDSSNTSSPTVSEVSIRVILTLALMANWAIHVVDIQGAYLHGEFNDDENLFMEIKCGRDLELLIKTGVDDFTKASGLKEPDISDNDALNRAKLTKYGQMLDMYLQREDAYNENKAKLFAVIYGQ